MHQYLSHLLTSNYNQLGLIVMFAICKIMNCFNLSFQQLAERIASPPPFPSVKSPITVSPPTSFPTMKSPVREMVSERGNRSESPPSRGMSIIFIYYHQWVCPISLVFFNKKKNNIQFFHCFFSVESSPKPRSAVTLLDVLNTCLEHMPKGIMTIIYLTDPHPVYKTPDIEQWRVNLLSFVYTSDVRENPSSISDSNIVWVTKWVDYSNKYGFGFQLSNDVIGVLFNDTSRIVMSPDGR